MLFDNKHPGVDFSLPEGTSVYAAYPGIVVRKEFHDGMGNVVGLRNGNIIFLYAHLSEFNVELGQKLTQGETIGKSGNTGSATTAPHLHFEMRDLTKKELKAMVFEPQFGKLLKQWRETFKNRVFNQNTSKTLYFLSERYFGTRNYWSRILEENIKLSSNPEETIEEGTLVVIPNY